ncbi:MAG: 4'-phosphopantetheinyl transferase superfamily protein [Mogibacterium sp.]|nr:4'-phosphopantetheinyl transferase superfamily protein [Mogibacterium sp.]
MIICYTHHYQGSKGESHRLLERAIAEYTGDKDRASCLVGSLKEVGEFGKPVIPDFDGFSISHSRNTWAVIIAGPECGLDIQYPRAGRFRDTAERFYHPADAASVAAQGEEEDASKEFFRLWTRREALIKAAGTSVAASDVPSVLESEPEYEGRRWVIREVTLPGEPDLSAAVCVPSGAIDEHDSIEYIDINNDR